jgi:hypothetical protein
MKRALTRSALESNCKEGLAQNNDLQCWFASAPIRSLIYKNVRGIDPSATPPCFGNEPASALSGI